MATMNLPRIGITLGDPAGVGPEVTAKALVSGLFPLERIALVGNKAHFIQVARDQKAELDFTQLAHFIDIPSEKFKTGSVSGAAGSVAIRSIEEAVRLALLGDLDAICTAPISKEAIRLAGSRFIDHTTMLQELTSSKEVTTVFETGSLRIIFLTKHLPIREAINEVTAANLERCIELADRALRSLGMNRRRIAVAALNPHGGENGLLGQEELGEIVPAVEKMRGKYDVHGPIPADSVFHQAAGGYYDIVISLYHDQGHIAAKTMNFAKTISMNLGLPFLRTSVDHGTAFDIAGRGIADATSMIEAIRKCFDYSPGYSAFLKHG